MSSQPAAFKPKVVGLACCSHVRPGIGVAACSRANAAEARMARVSSAANNASTARSLQDDCRVHDVLTGGATMNVACRFGIPGSDCLGQLADERNHDVAGGCRFRDEGRHIKGLRASGSADIRYARGGNDTDFRLGDCQCDLDVEKGLQVFPIPDRRHQISKNTVSFSPCTTTLNEYSPAVVGWASNVCRRCSGTSFRTGSEAASGSSAK